MKCALQVKYAGTAQHWSQPIKWCSLLWQRQGWTRRPPLYNSSYW